MAKHIGNLQDKSGNILLPNDMEIITNSNGTAFKFSSGLMICYATTETKTIKTTDFSVSSEYDYRYSVELPNFPFSFISIPYVNCLNVASSILNVFYIEKTTNNKWGTARVGRSSLIDSTLKMNCIAIGRWK